MSEKAKANQISPEKRTVKDKNGQNMKMEALDGRTRELRSSVGGRRARWKKPVVRGSLTCHPHGDACGIATGEGHACDCAWELGFRSSCLCWIDQALVSRRVDVSCR